MDDNWKRLCQLLGVTRNGEPVVVGVDMGDPDGDLSAAQCPHCWHVEKWREKAPKRCSNCARRHNFAGLYIIK